MESTNDYPLTIWARIKNYIYKRKPLRASDSRKMMPHPDATTLHSMDEQFMNELKQVIERNLSKMDFRIDDIARELCISRATLNRRIKAITGKSPNQFKQLYRLKRAAQLLEANVGNVTEVAFRVGFSNSCYFTKCFRETFHQLPHTYRTRNEIAL